MPKPIITYADGVRVEYHPGRAIVRPLITSRSRIIAVMAEDMRHIAAAAGGVTEAGLKLVGWTAAQIATCHEEAAVLAHSRAGDAREATL